jgi:hypothetical protein
MVVIAIVRHLYLDVPDVDVLPALPEVEPEVLDPVEPAAPLLELEPAPVSVEVTDPETLPGVVVTVVVVSLVVDEEVGEVDVVVVEPGVELVPELLYDVLPVLASRWQPARPAVASARAAMQGMRRFMAAPFLSVLVKAYARRAARHDLDATAVHEWNSWKDVFMQAKSGLLRRMEHTVIRMVLASVGSCASASARYAPRFHRASCAGSARKRPGSKYFDFQIATAARGTSIAFAGSFARTGSRVMTKAKSAAMSSSERRVKYSYGNAG